MKAKMQHSGPDSVNVFHWTLQSGWVYRVKVDPQKCGTFEDEHGEQRWIGYQGNEVPPCGAEQEEYNHRVTRVQPVTYGGELL
jgi:hypothetical protein